MTSEKQGELAGKFSDKEVYWILWEGHFISHGKKQIYSVIVELTLNEKKKCISKTNNKVQHFCFVKSSILNFLGPGFLLDSL